MRHDGLDLAQIRANPRLLIEGCLPIVEGDTQRAVPFKFRYEQDKYWRAKTKCDEILKPRKRGFSALIDAEFLCACILEQHVNAVVVSHREEDTKILFNRVHWMLKNLPFKVPVSEAGAGHLRFSATDSHFRVITAGAQDPGRGSDITHLHLSERAFYPHEGFLAAVEGACTKNARRVIETTANGFGTPFHKHWLRSKRGETAYKTHFFPWWEAPDYEMDPGGKLVYDDLERQLVDAYGPVITDRKLAWRRQKLREMSNPDLFPQEYPANDQEAFLVSGRMVFDWISLERMAQAVQEPKWRGVLRNLGQRVELIPQADGELAIWAMPREDRHYVLSADVAEGVPGGAYSVVDVLDTATWEQVAQWRGHVSPAAFVDVMGDMGAYYNWGLLAPEVNNHGLTVVTGLRDKGYPNLYTREISEKRTDYGWLTTTKSKLAIIDHLAHALRQLDVKINSAATLDELKAFVYLRQEDGRSGNTERDTMGPQAGAFSDCVMSLAIGVAILGDQRETPMSTRQRFREAMGIRRSPAPVRPRESGYGIRRA